MNKIIRHLRADTNTWEVYRTVIPDGEIAIEKTEGGNTRLRVGNGIDKFTDLPAIGGDARRIYSGSVNVAPSRIYRLVDPPYVDVILPRSPDLDFFTEISFTTGDDAPDFTLNKTVRFSGDDVAGEEFLPRANMHYTLCIWYDGEYQGVVRGLPNA